ncbi:MAG: hypothetical protein ONB44_14525 [candidate division KSB1 bacterium]|nr:hypothetical protein [candidate division KSB1 bacterium]MDZ7303342.1 hypothetical protein [candidate division KSB1 bacterium]MDZ7310408.1 hypothetical protein [candidate division KSB1 bacterium]
MNKRHSRGLGFGSFHQKVSFRRLKVKEKKNKGSDASLTGGVQSMSYWKYLVAMKHSAGLKKDSCGRSLPE